MEEVVEYNYGEPILAVVWSQVSYRFTVVIARGSARAACRYMAEEDNVLQEQSQTVSHSVSEGQLRVEANVALTPTK